MGPSAALTPAIWEKTIPYDGESFHLEYMDLEEFLLENDIPTSPDVAALKEEFAAVTEEKMIPPEEVKVSRSAGGVSAVTLMPIQELDKSEDELLFITKSDSDITCDVSTGELLLAQTLFLSSSFGSTSSFTFHLPQR